MEKIQVSREQVRLIQENVKQEVKLLTETIERIMGIESLISLENYFESPAILRKLVINEVRIMHNDVQKVLETFQDNIDSCFELDLENDNMVDIEITVPDCDDLEHSETNESIQTGNKTKPVSPSIRSDFNELDFILETCNDVEKGNLDIDDITIKHEVQIETDSKEEVIEAEHNNSSYGSFKLIARFPCIYCTKIFCTHLELRRHNKNFHNFDGVCCPICEKQMKFPREVDEHIRCFHTGERPFECTVCGKTFSRGTSFKVHQRVHSTVRPFICEMCGKAFRSRQDVQSHKILHIGERTYICAVCGKGFVRSQNLTQHMKTHNKSKSKRTKKKTVSSNLKST